MPTNHKNSHDNPHTDDQDERLREERRRYFTPGTEAQSRLTKRSNWHEEVIEKFLDEEGDAANRHASIPYRKPKRFNHEVFGADRILI